MDGWVEVKTKNRKLIGTKEVSSDSTFRSKNYFTLLNSHSTPIDPNPPSLPNATSFPLIITTASNTTTASNDEAPCTPHLAPPGSARGCFPQQGHCHSRARAHSPRQDRPLQPQTHGHRRSTHIPHYCTLPHPPRHRPWAHSSLQRQTSSPEAHIHQTCSLCPHTHSPPLSHRSSACCPGHL